MWQNQAPPVLDGMFGNSWRSNYEELLDFSEPNVVTYYRGDGSSWVFASEGYLLTPGNAGIQPCGLGIQALCYDSNKMQYFIIFSDGSKRMFRSGCKTLATPFRFSDLRWWEGGFATSSSHESAGGASSFPRLPCNNGRCDRSDDHQYPFRGPNDKGEHYCGPKGWFHLSVILPQHCRCQRHGAGRFKLDEMERLMTIRMQDDASVRLETCADTKVSSGSVIAYSVPGGYHK